MSSYMQIRNVTLLYNMNECFSGPRANLFLVATFLLRKELNSKLDLRHIDATVVRRSITSMLFISYRQSMFDCNTRKSHSPENPIILECQSSFNNFPLFRVTLCTIDAFTRWRHPPSKVAACFWSDKIFEWLECLSKSFLYHFENPTDNSYLKLEQVSHSGHHICWDITQSASKCQNATVIELCPLFQVVSSLSNSKDCKQWTFHFCLGVGLLVDRYTSVRA